MTDAALYTPPYPTERALRSRRQIRWWLYGICLLVFAMVVVGGATRLTDSGLSITEWKPIHGAIPPIGEAEWQEEFAKYRQIPEYEQINKGMTLSEFKFIFWWEWAHRLLGRIVGVAFFVPLVWFWARGQIEPKLKPRLVGLFLLGGLQGGIGWWMVSSGLVDRVDVSQYRLAIHLTIACLIFSWALWLARGLAPQRASEPAARGQAGVAILLVVLGLAQVFLGGLVAGLHAGLTYNTWPLMDGELVPSGLLMLEPAWRNFFENITLVQFQHRIGAYVLFACALAHLIDVRRRSPGHAKRAMGAFMAVTSQAVLGIATLLLVVPFWFALAHQALAVAVLGMLVVHAQALSKAR
ncbi:COX15/CtaA family protein [Breoghania sp. L-A4]|uniref:COX15/CtaA family protein n=1 Tax=Breoghania sp. L-A4 TaxID=2304600 RepID=UPI000E358D98|nr:COX15/CtaA family protein [Breoghania sp. L-A4]AXS41641.1 heme A synthase [Breoghania sp. L-A4]